MAVVGDKCIMSSESGLHECKILECPHASKPRGCEYVEVNPSGTAVHRFYMYDLKKFEEFPEDTEPLEAILYRLICEKYGKV